MFHDLRNLKFAHQNGRDAIKFQTILGVRFAVLGRLCNHPMALLPKTIDQIFSLTCSKVTMNSTVIVNSTMSSFLRFFLVLFAERSMLIKAFPYCTELGLSAL